MSKLTNDLSLCNYLMLVGIALFSMEDIIPEGAIKTILLNIGFYSAIIGIGLGAISTVYYFFNKESK